MHGSVLFRSLVAGGFSCRDLTACLVRCALPLQLQAAQQLGDMSASFGFPLNFPQMHSVPSFSHMQLPAAAGAGAGGAALVPPQNLQQMPNLQQMQTLQQSLHALQRLRGSGSGAGAGAGQPDLAAVAAGQSQSAMQQSLMLAGHLQAAETQRRVQQQQFSVSEQALLMQQMQNVQQLRAGVAGGGMMTMPTALPAPPGSGEGAAAQPQHGWELFSSTAPSARPAAGPPMGGAAIVMARPLHSGSTVLGHMGGFMPFTTAQPSMPLVLGAAGEPQSGAPLAFGAQAEQHPGNAPAAAQLASSQGQAVAWPDAAGNVGGVPAAADDGTPANLSLRL